MTSPDSVPEQVAAQAESIVDTLQETSYKYSEHIDAGHGRYDCDCSQFVGFVLSHVAPEQYGMILHEPGRRRPRAFEYYDFLSSRTPQSPAGWRRIDLLRDTRRGDIITWRYPEVVTGHDTGHVLIVAQTPEVNDQGGYTVGAYDSARWPHFDDTRGTGDGQSPDGVGHGSLLFRVDADSRPLAVLFSPTESGFQPHPIAVGRLEPLTVGPPGPAPSGT